MGELPPDVERELEWFGERCRQFNEALAADAEPALRALAEVGRRFNEAIREGVIEMERRLREGR